MERGREDEARNSELWANLYQWLATRDAPADDVERVRRLAWPALKYANDAHLSKTAADEMFPSPLRASARQLETFRACPFQHFARYGLHLSPRARALGDSQEVSRACREVLSGLVRRLLMFGTNWCDFPPKRLENLLHQFALAVASERAGASAVSARDAHLAERIENAVGQIVAAQKAASQRSLFRPAEAAVRFGDHGALPPLEIKTRSGKSVLLSGEIDRVDLSADGGATIVYDYRMKAPALSLAEIYHGLRLSQPVNLLAWLQTREKTHTRPAAALTVPIRREAIDADPRKALEPSDERFALQSKPRGIISEQFAPDMDSGIQPSSHSDALALYVNKEAEFRMRSRTDIAAPNEFAAMLDHVGRMLGRLADEILEGRIAVAPYKMGTQTPCSHCNFLDVCRFETTDRHELLRTMSREKALELMGSTKPG
jgi:ATP-dependent helicase/nuclease subunit B